MPRIGTAAIAGFALLAGCTTHLETRPDRAVSQLDQALPGHGYRLPMLQYQIDVVYRLASCPGTDAGQPTTLAFVTQAKAGAGHVAGEGYTIDYEKLSNVFKTTDFSVEAWEKTGALKAINASADDRTGDAIKSAVEVGIAVASLAAGNPLAIMGAVQGEDGGAGAAADALLRQADMNEPLLCTDGARRALADAAAARIRIRQLNALIGTSTREIEAITVRATLRMSDRGDAARLLVIHRAQIRRSDELAAAQSALAAAEGPVVFTETRYWPERADTVEGRLGLTGAFRTWATSLVKVGSADTVPGPGGASVDRRRNVVDSALLWKLFESNPPPEAIRDSVRRRLEASVRRQTPAATAGFCAADVPVEECLGAQVDVHATLVAEGDKPQDCPSAEDRPCRLPRDSAAAISARSDVAHPGIFFRQPVRAYLLLCDRSVPCIDGSREPLLRGEWNIAPQLGQLRFAPLTNGPFQNNALSLALREDGTVARFQYAEKSAILAQALATASTVATRLEAERDTRAKEARQGELDRRTDVAYVRAEAAAVRADDIARTQYEIDRIAKDQELLAKRSPPTTSDPVVAQAFLDETLRYEAEAVQLQWQLAAMKAQDAIARRQ
ncbi:hypothetical protein [Sphingomonas sp. CFBP 13733]|uniref:hypothetical protein n=1 Tax=Sphingomonas sp. CFBP 13733 TaxID=2775291 RepID=UPI00177B6465|nr:hypothetical protein [Sphingomonas sp. CFBP 13733]MBD8640250.1 hypothetical protein [Sphingomonas sp. CFBP 13733]